jgi:general secretion pathway protein D
MNRLALIFAVIATLVSGPGWAKTSRKGDQYLAAGKAAEARHEFDAALENYEKALATDPSEAVYLLHVRRLRFAAAQSHVDEGQKLRTAGNLEGALAEFQRAFAIDPSSALAEVEARRTIQMIDRDKARSADPTQKPLTRAERGLTPSEAARSEAEQRASRLESLPELKPLSTQVSNLKLVNQKARVLYETVGKLAGLNVLVDPEFQDNKPVTLELTSATLNEALDYIALMTKTYWKPLSANAIFVTQDNVTKRRDYEEHVARVFYLQNLTSAQELQEVMTAMRSVTDVRKVMPINSQSAIVVRGTADQVALAEKVLLDLDRPKSEVMVDIIVMEVNRKKSRDLALTPYSSGAAGLSMTGGFAPGGKTSGSVSIQGIKSLGLGDWSTTVPSVLFKALMTDSDSKIVNSPQLRATDGQKASMKIGDKYPYATGSYSAGVTTTTTSALVSTQFQFADVGVNVDLTPRIHGSEEVSMQVELEISNITEKVDVGGLTQPVIGQRKVNHIIRVKDGEIALIGGLMQSTYTKTKGGVPFLMNIPLIGKFFTSESITDNKSDLVVALVPHIIRAPDIGPDNLRTIATGSDTIYRVNYAPAKAEEKPAAKPAAAPAQAPVVAPAAPAAQSPDTPANAQPAPQGAALLLKTSASEVALNGAVTANVQVDNIGELFSAPMRIKYNPAVLKLVDVRNGSFLGGDGQQVTFSETRAEDVGAVIVNLSRVAGAGGISGSGTLLTLVFQAAGKGTSTISFAELSLRDARLDAIPVAPQPASVTVK